MHGEETMTDTAREQSVEDKTLAEDLDAALAEALQEVAEEEVAEEVAEEEESTEDALDEDPEEDSEEEEALEPPQHWAADDRELFANLPKDGQEYLLRRHKDMEADYTRKTQEIALVRKKAEAFNEVFEPYRRELAINGLDEVSAVRQLLAIRDELRANPKATLTSLAKQYGVDFQQEEEHIDPSVAALKNELESIKQEQARRDYEAQQQTQSDLEKQVDSFQNEKDAQGNLKHPHFADLRVDMGRLIQSGLAADMPEAYAKALAFRPELTPKKAESKPDESQKEKVRKAKKAAAGVKSSGAATKAEPKSLREELEAQFAAHS